MIVRTALYKKVSMAGKLNNIALIIATVIITATCYMSLHTRHM